jgi:hypothetical protein
MNFIWHILLTVCLDTQQTQCKSQDVQWFEKEQECKKMIEVYRAIPTDGDWQTVHYICKPVGSRGT